MSNIFKNSKFGDRFTTNDGRQALYLYKKEYSGFDKEFYPDLYVLILEDEEEMFEYGQDGKINPLETRCIDENGIIEVYSQDIVL